MQKCIMVAPPERFKMYFQMRLRNIVGYKSPLIFKNLEPFRNDIIKARFID